MRKTASYAIAHLCGDIGVMLIELMVAMAVGLVVIGATFQAVSFFQQEYTKQHVRAVRHQDLRLALDLLEQELRVAGSGAISVATQAEVQFMANVHDLVTSVTTTAAAGQSTISVENGGGWSAGKAIVVCAAVPCETFTLARDGQRSLLFLNAPLSRIIPVGVSVSMVNHVRYYTRQNENGYIQLMRMIDGGASLLVDDLQSFRLSYWNERGVIANNRQQITRIVVEVLLGRETIGIVRDIRVHT